MPVGEYPDRGELGLSCDSFSSLLRNVLFFNKVLGRVLLYLFFSSPFLGVLLFELETCSLSTLSRLTAFMTFLKTDLFASF